MLPLFKSHFSIGKSILTLDHPDKVIEDGPDSIFSIAQENNLQELYLVEDSMTGFFEAFRKCNDLGIQLIFGYRFTCCTCLENKDSCHKLVAFAKDDAGCKDLNQLYSFINTESDGKITNDDLLKMWSPNLILAVPFYDSFIFNNQLYLGNCVPEFKDIEPIFFIEQNNLPFDLMIKSAVEEYAQQHNYDTFLTKSIYYRNKSDCDAFQSYKIVCNRSFGKQATLSSPNLNHFGSDEFCWESFVKNNFTP